MVKLKKKKTNLKKELQKNKTMVIYITQKDYKAMIKEITKLKVKCALLSKGAKDSMRFTKFVHSLVAASRTKKTKVVFVVIKEDVGTPIMEDVKMFVDEVIEV